MSCWKLLYDKQTYKNRHNLQQRNKPTADDIDIVGRSQAAVRNAYLALEGEAAKVGLKINEQKTKYMIAARNDRTIRDVGQSVAIGNKHIEVIKEFVYLRISDDTNELRESGNTTKNPDCK
jgi:hypothetical protein